MGTMNNVTKIILATICVCLWSCSDNQQQNKDDSARHLKSAAMYQEQGQYRAAMIEAKNAIQLQSDSPEGYISLAQVYNEIGAYAATQDLLNPVVKTIPAVATELARAYYFNGKYLSAINTINSHPADASNSAERLRQLWVLAMSNIYLGNKDGYEQDLADYQKAGGSEAEANYIRANYELSKGEIEKAKTTLESILAAQPDHQDALILMAGVQVVVRKLDNAEQLLTKALGQLKNTDILSRKKSQIISLLTDTLIQQGRTSEAYTYQKILAEANPEANAAQQRFNEAMELYQQGKYADSEAILRELREQFPNDKNTATLLGMVEYQQGANQNAGDLFDQFVDPETANPSVLQAAALVKFRNNQVEAAIELLKKAADSQPNNPVVLATYGLALLDKDPESTEGANILEKSLAINPNQQRIRIALANRHLKLGEQEQAVAQLQKAHQEQPTDLFIQQAYYKTLLQVGQIKELQEEIENYKINYPESSRGHFFAGWLATQQKQLPQAEKAFESAIAVPDGKERHLAYAGLAQVYEEQKQPQKAIAAWQQALEAEPGLAIAYSRWLKLMQELKRDQEAFKFLQQLEQKTTRWEPSVVLAQIYGARNSLDEALKHGNVALERSNQNMNVKGLVANIYRLQGVQYRAQNKLQEARESLMQAVKLVPDNPSFLGNLIETEIAAQNIPEAQKLLDQFVKTPENEAERLFLQGMIRLAENKKEDALKLYEESWAKKPLETVAEQLFASYKKAGDETKANDFLSDWQAKIPNSRTATLMKAMTLQKNDDKTEAIALYEKSLQSNPNVPAALNNLAWMYYEAKDPRAQETAKKAYELAPNVAPIVDTYGWILVENGELQKGIELLNKAVQLDPQNKEIQDHLIEAKKRQ